MIQGLTENTEKRTLFLAEKWDSSLSCLKKIIVLQSKLKKVATLFPKTLKVVFLNFGQALYWL